MKNGLRESYDFWELKKNGSFYLFKNLFEDSRGSKLLYFDVRVKRVAEALARIGKLYKRLGAQGNSLIGIKLVYGGLSGRKLIAASPDFFMPTAKISSENFFEWTLTTTVDALNNADELSLRVIEICRDLFLLFDGAKLGDSIYKKILGDFLSKSI